MIVAKVTKRYIALFTAAFLLCGVLHVVLYRMDFTMCFAQLYCGALTVAWASTVQRRVTNRALRRLMLCVSATIVMNFVLQVARYQLFAGQIAEQRYLWYIMYVPMTAQPILCFYIAALIYRPENKSLPRFHWLLVALGALLALGVLTNDLHFWAKSFPSGVLDDNGQEKNGWLFYVVSLFQYGLYAAAFLTILRKSRRFVLRRYRWIPLVPFLIGIVYSTTYPLDIGHKLFSTRLYEIGEMFAFCVIATLEACIQIGMIPVNRGYEKLFSAAPLRAVILDGNGRLVYQTADVVYPFPPSRDDRVVSHTIRGGSVAYLVDVARARDLNEKLEEVTEQIEARNAYIAEENRIKAELAELETRNRLYERISVLVTPQLDKIERLLNAPEGCDRDALCKIAVLKAYVKRRSNLELLAAADTLIVEELASAVSESLSYLRLCGVNTAVYAFGTGA
ncbi:MAG: hypothetical protein IJ138_05670, partial [Clostridia bacterium]|nr:hypothetical protein [Clostridia bacterium]